MGAHLIDGQFQSDKYPTCPRGKVPLSVKDATAQDLLWEYAQRRRAVDAEFAEDLVEALRRVGYVHAGCRRCVDCEGSPHHWVEDPPEDGRFTDWACRHCEARGLECPYCGGDEEEREGCDLCGGDGVVEVVTRGVAAATAAEEIAALRLRAVAAEEDWQAAEAKLGRLRQQLADARGLLQGVTRTAAEGEADLTLTDESHPCANGRQPTVGEQAWTFRFKLEDGRRVDLKLGREARDNFRAMMLAEEMDDAAAAERH